MHTHVYSLVHTHNHHYNHKHTSKITTNTCTSFSARTPALARSPEPHERHTGIRTLAPPCRNHTHALSSLAHESPSL